MPAYSFGRLSVSTTKITAIQVGFKAVLVPPSCFVGHRTVPISKFIALVIIIVFSAEHHSIVVFKWVTSITCDKNMYA